MKKILFYIFFVLFTCQVNGQFEFSSYEEDYTPLYNSQPLTLEVWDDPILFIPLGFEFELFGRTIEELTTVGGYHNELFTYSETDSTQHVIIPFLADLIDPGVLSGVSEGNISYEVTGTAPFRTCKIQWENCAFYNEGDVLGTYDDRVNFQVWLLESVNAIEYHYGEMNISYPEINLDNQNGTYIGIIEEMSMLNEYFLNEYHITNTISFPELENTFSNFIELYLADELSLTPINGQVFRFEAYQTSTDINVLEEDNKTTVYPTVIEDEFTISTLLKSSYKIYNCTGQLIKTGVLSDGDNILTLEKWRSGVYLLQVLSERGEKTFKLVKK